MRICSFVLDDVHCGGFHVYYTVIAKQGHVLPAAVMISYKYEVCCLSSVVNVEKVPA